MKKGCRFHTGLIRLTWGMCFFSWSLMFAQKIPAPEDILGFKPGTDYHLATYTQALEYFYALEKACSTFRTFEMGRTSQDRPMVYAVITSEENMQRLDHYKEISRKLSLARGLSDEDAAGLAAEGRAVVWIDVGIHASECAPSQHALQLAYDLVTAEDADTRLILDNTILLLVFANPDGMEMVADWYHSQLGTPYETSPMPWLYNKYAGHDNNRDSYMNNLAETQNITRLLNREWYPVVLYDHHQTAPFPARIWIPPAAEPTSPNLHPLFVRGKNLIGSAMGYDFDREEKSGAISRFAFDFIYPGYEDSFCDFFNVISIMTETALYRYATPRFYTVDDFPEEYRDFTPGVFYPSPWKGGWWRLGDAVEYCLTASKSVLRTAALYRERFLHGKYSMGKDTIARFRREPPFAWIIPREQHDAATAALMLNRLLLQGIEVSQAAREFTADGRSYPAGTWVIPMDQPFALFVKTLFEEQSYPDMMKYPALWQGIVRPRKFEGAYLPPYDVSGWTLPYQMGVRVVVVQNPLEAELKPIAVAAAPVGRVESGRGTAFLLSPRINNSYIAVNRILKRGGEVLRARSVFKSGQMEYPAGTMIVSSRKTALSTMRSLAKELSLPVGVGSPPLRPSAFRLRVPRIALYQSWRANMDEGWTRWLLEAYEFPFRSIHDAEIRAGKLEDSIDVLIIPSQSTDALINGHKPGTVPARYAGGITETGVRNIRSFVENGGTLVALNAGCRFVLEKLGIPLQDSTRTQNRADGTAFACPGSLLRIQFDNGHPVAFGMPREAAGMFYRSPILSASPGFSGENRVTPIARYPENELLLSGFLRGEKELRNKTAAAEVVIGAGKAILLGFGVQNRAQSYGTFKLLFNAIYYGAGGEQAERRLATSQLNEAYSQRRQTCAR